MSFVQGIDHLGLTVSDLEASKAFFVEALGFEVIGGNPDYPAVYVGNGQAKLTLWQQKGPDQRGFDRHAHVGLHHVAFKVPDQDALTSAYKAVCDWPGVDVEFGPEFSGHGPKCHFMIRESGGVRVEVSFDPR